MPVGINNVIAVFQRPYVFGGPAPGVFATSTSTGSAVQTVTQDQTTTMLSDSNPATVPYGTPLTYTATVTNDSVATLTPGALFISMSIRRRPAMGTTSATPS